MCVVYSYFAHFSSLFSASDIKSPSHSAKPSFSDCQAWVQLFHALWKQKKEMGRRRRERAGFGETKEKEENVSHKEKNGRECVCGVGVFE